MSVDPRLARLQGRTAIPNPNPSQNPPPPSQPSLSPSSPPAIAIATEQPSIQPSPDVVAVPEPQAEITSTTPPTQPPTKADESYKLKFCTVCASNNNRSMEAHLRLSTGEKEFPVISFGTGSSVRLPGPSISQPQVYDFNTTSYTRMYEELQAQDARLYKNNGILNMLDRNRNIKWGPERFQDWKAGVARMEMINRGDKGAMGTEGGVVDVIFTCEERCWDAVVDNLLDRGAPLNRPVHVFNVDIRDNHEEALVGGRAILELANDLNDAANEERKQLGSLGWENGSGAARQSFDERVPDILGDWQTRWPNLPAQWTLSWL